MDLKGYTTVDEVGEDSQVRNVESFKPATAAEEIEYLNKILEKIEKCEVKENSKEGKYKIENITSDNNTHRNDSFNNNAVEPLTESCSLNVNIEHENTECEQNYINDERRDKDKLEQHSENCSLNEIIDERDSDFNKSVIEGYGLPCADDILTQAESQHSVIQENKSHHVQNELSTEPSLIMANPSVTNLEDNSKQKSSCTQSNIGSNADLEEKIEIYRFESISLETANENGSSELSSSTMEATVMPVICSTEISSVLESGHYSAKDTFDFVSGEDISGSSNLDSVELDDVSALSNVVLGDIGSLLKCSADHSNVTEENTVAECEAQIDLSIVKLEPVCSDPGEEFDLKDFCNDPAEEFVLNEHNVKEEPIDYVPSAPMISQEEVLLPVKIFKTENDMDDQVITPNIGYLVEDLKHYSREEVSAALLISQSSLSPTIDMEMFQNLGRTKLTVKLSRLENVLQHPKQLVLEDFNIVQLFRSNYGTSIQEWKNFFAFKTNYSAKHTGKKNMKKHINNALFNRKKGKRGRKKKHLTEKSHSNPISNSCNFKSDEEKDEVSEQIETRDCLPKLIHQSSDVCSRNEDPVQLKEETNQKNLCDFVHISKFEDESKTSMNDNLDKKKRKRISDSSDLDNSERTNESSVKEENNKLQREDSTTSHTLVDTLQEKNNEKKLDASYQLNDTCKACFVHLSDIANDPMYGKVVRNYLKLSNENRVLEHTTQQHLKESFKEEDISSPLIEKENTSGEIDHSFAGCSSAQLKEQMSLLLKNVKDLVATTGKVDFDVREIEENVLLKEENENIGEAAEPDETSVARKESSEISYCKKNINIEMEMELEKGPEAKTELEKRNDTGMKLEKGDKFQKDKDERRARKRQKLGILDIDAEIINPKERKDILSETDFHRGKSETDQEAEGNSIKYDQKKEQFADYKKNKEDFLTNKDRNPIAAASPSLASFKIPKKKPTHVREHKTQEQNSVLRRRGETPITQKSIGYSSNKHLSVQNKKKDHKEKESYNVRNLKKEMRPVIPAHPQPPIVEGWAKMRSLPLHSGDYHPQAGFSNMDVRYKCSVPIVHPESGNPKAQFKTANQIRMHSSQHIGHVRPPVIAKAEYHNFPSSNYGVMNQNQPVKEISIPINIPPPPPLEKLDLSSLKFGQGSGNIQSLPYEPSPVISHGNSSDGESDVSEICISKLTSAQSPSSNVSDTPNTDTTEMCKASSSCTVPSITNVTGTPDIDMSEVHKVSSSNAQPLQTNVAGIPKTNTDISSEVILKPREMESIVKVATCESLKSTKDYYQHLDKKQKIKLYEKRKRYYYESKKRYHIEKGEKKKVWCKEYEKRKNEYYHLKIYLYKERKRELIENKLPRKKLENNSNDKHSQVCDEAEALEHKVARSNPTVEAEEEVPYSPTASPIDYDDNVCSIELQTSLHDDAPRKQIMDEKDQEGNILLDDDYDENFYKIDVKASLLDAPRKTLEEEYQEGSTILNYPTDKLKEMIGQVMSALNQKSGKEECKLENQSVDTEVKSKVECESKADDKSQPLDSTSSIASLAKPSNSLCVPSSSLSLPHQQTPMTVPPTYVSSTLDKTPLPVPPPSGSLSLPPLVFSKGTLNDSVLTNSSSMGVSSPQPVPSPVAISSFTSSSTSNEALIHDESLCLEVPSTKAVSTAELPLSASPIVEKSHIAVPSKHSVLTLTSQSVASFTQLPSSSALPQHGKEFTTECKQYSEKDSECSVSHEDVFPPLPSTPPPPPPPTSEEESIENISGSIEEKYAVIEDASDDMTQVPMDIDSENDNDRDDDEMSDCHDSDVIGIETVSRSNNDKEYLSQFGICGKKSPPLEKEIDEDSNKSHLTKLLKKLMNVSKSNKPVDTSEKECGSNPRMEEVTTDFTVDKASSCLNSTTSNQQKVVDSKPSKEQNSPLVSNVSIGKATSPATATDEEIKKDSSERQLEVTSVSSNKENEKETSSDATQSASFKNEIEIIGMREPRKNLICVDEILMSVEAADQSPDLQIIYTGSRSDPRDMKNIIRDEVPKYYQKTAMAQTLVDKCKDIPLVGLQYVLEVRKDLDMTLDGCYYICAVCSKKMSANTLVAHIKSVPHRLKFSETHCKHIHNKYASYDLKEWTASLVKEFTSDLAQIEKKMGRHKLAVAYERDISSVLKSLKQKISHISNLSQVQEKKVTVDQPITSVVDVKEVPLPDSSVPKYNGPSVLSKKDIPLPLKPKSPAAKGGSITKNYDDEEQDEDVILVSDTKKAANVQKFSSNGQGFTKRNYRPGPNSRRRSSSRSSTPTLSPRKTWSRSKSRSKSKSPKRTISHSPSNKQMKHGESPHRKPDRPIYTAGKKRRHSRSPASSRRHSRSRSGSRDLRKSHKTRSRSRSRHRSPYRRKDIRSRRSPPPKRESSEERARRVARRKLEDFREAEVRIKAKHKNLQIVYEKTPESHPLYNREWKLFWERRCRELEKDGVDPFLYDFKSEWVRFWLHRMKEIMDTNYKSKRDALLRKLRMDDPDLEENRLSSMLPNSSWKPGGENVERVSRIDRSPSPWEQDEGGSAIARNPSPAPGEVMKSIEMEDSSKSHDIATSKFEDDFSVIGTLKLLNELEDQLGSFGPAISTLLGKAVDCSQKGEDTLELFKDPDNLVLIRYAREKLSSQISAGILGVSALMKTQMAVERSMWLQSQAEELANGGKYLGLDIAGIARATLGRDTVQIAQYIAQHLLQVGKSNASEANLQNILFAVLAAHTKLLVETSKKTQIDAPVSKNVVPVSSSVVTASDDPPKKLPSTCNETSEDTKQPLFPSTVESDDKKDDGNSSEKMGGLSLLQNAYEDEHGKEMENLSLEDLRSLLANFSSLDPEEKQALTSYLKKLEATDSKKVMKLREEIQKSAKTATKTSSMKSAFRPGKSSLRSQNVLNADSNNQVSQQKPSEGTQESIPREKHCPEMPPLQTSDDRNIRSHSMENINSQDRVSQNQFIGGPETDAMHDSRGMLRPPASLDPPLNNMPPVPIGMNEMAHDFGQSIRHNPDGRPRHIDQPMFEDGRNRAFPPGPFMQRPEAGFGISEPHKYNVNNHDRNFDRFGYEPVQESNNPMGPQNLGRCNRPPEANNLPWQGFGSSGPCMDNRSFPPRDEMNYNRFDDGPQPPYKQRDFATRGRPDYPFRGGPHRGHHPNIRQPYREPW